MKRYLLLLILLFLNSVYTSAQHLRFNQDPTSPWFGQVVIEDLDQEQQHIIALDSLNWPNILKVYTNHGQGFQQTQAVLGSYKFQHGTFGFRPRFPFEPGTCYQAAVPILSLAELHFCPELRSLQTTANQVTVYPTGKVVPANILRFYLYFDMPMRADNPYKHINLINSQGDTVSNVIYPAEPALWSSNQQRLTVLLDPGRVKRGLMANKQWGLAFAPGSEYFLVISKDITDQWGNSLTEDYVHPLLISETDYHSPDMNSWNITIPVINTRGLLKVEFDEPMDHAQCSRWINISLNDHILEGSWELGDNEMWAAFSPNTPWTAGAYQVMVYNKLEDRSGNSIRKPFEITSLDIVEEPAWQHLDFEIK